ncbi:hypothetical protein GQ53DRAFT_880525 [Thozetella sp. PMI_491]|nr:hypothetical protein GQ53DRAFT_880525 [Thozetella sp. PMI_491]
MSVTRTTPSGAINASRLSSARKSRDEWTPSSLKWLPFLGFMVIDLAFIAIIVALKVISSRQNGIVAIVDGQAFNILGYGVGTNLLWTSLPSVIFGMFAILWVNMAEESAVRQPYVEMSRPGGAQAMKSIFLDYRTPLLLTRWFKAFRNGHWMAGVALLSTLIFDKGLSSLSSALLYPRQVAMDSPVSVSYNTTFNASAIGADLDWRPVFDTVSATAIWGGGALPWTNSEFAFQPFYQASRSDPVFNITANTTGYSAYLDCKVIDSSAYSLSLSNGKASLSANDRGCDISQSFDVTKIQPVYFKTTSQSDCDASAWYSRMVFTYGIYDSSSSNSLANVSVVSCISGYRTTNGLLTVSQGQGTGTRGGAAVTNFQPSESPREARPYNWRVIEQGLFGSVSFNPKAQWSTTDFGNIILYHARSKATPGTPTFDDLTVLGGDLLASSIMIVFTSSYLTATYMHGLGAGSTETASGTFTVQSTRLFVLDSVAYAMVTVLIVLLVLAIALKYYAWRNDANLVEKPESLMAYAVLLSNSSLMTERGVTGTAESKDAMGIIEPQSIWTMVGTEGAPPKIQRKTYVPDQGV